MNKGYEEWARRRELREGVHRGSEDSDERKNGREQKEEEEGGGRRDTSKCERMNDSDAAIFQSQFRSYENEIVVKARFLVFSSHSVA